MEVFLLMKDPIRPFVTAILVSAAALAGAAPATAQSIAQPRSWTLTPFLHTSADVSEPAFDNSIGLGVAVGYDLTRNLGFEGEIGHLFDVAGTTDNIDWSITNFSANAIYHFDVKRVTPYATLGIGLERSSYDLKADDDLQLEQDPSSSEVSINFGGGVKYPINDRWSARADLRRFQANDIAPDHWRVYGGLTWMLR
jgi:opacity protein-like surface antigen